MGKKNDQLSVKPVSDNELPPEFKKHDKPFGLEQHVYNWIFFFSVSHFSIIYFAYLFFIRQVIPPGVVLLFLVYGYMGGLGTTVGAHRYWTHRTFKAKLPLQILMMLLQTISWQYPIFKWCRDHRVHHKYTDTNADPHSAARGFWFSHITWLLLPKHPECEKALKVVDISDLARDPVVRFQSKYYNELVMIMVFLVPITLCKLVFPEMSYWHIFLANYTRFGISVHITSLVNSVAHMWGNKPYDKYISSVESKLVSFMAVGEGWHNYHHTFPWDYKSAEFGYYFNLSTVFIHFFAWIGWAYDLKTVSHKLLIDRISRTGDGTHPLHQKAAQNNKRKTETTDDIVSRTCWGWGDKQLRQEDMEITETRFPAKNRQGSKIIFYYMILHNTIYMAFTLS